jgi:hypothetical protein
MAFPVRPTTRRELFPNATVDGDLHVEAPVEGIMSARTWRRAIVASVVLGPGMPFMAFPLAAVIGEDRFNRLFGGPGIDMAAYATSDSDPWVLAGTWLQPIMVVAILALVVSCVITSRHFGRGRNRGTLVDWATWARERGFTAVQIDEWHAFASGSDLRLFTAGRDRGWAGPFRGLVGDLPVCAGATTWTTGSGRSRSDWKQYFVHVELPEAVAWEFPASSLMRLGSSARAVFDYRPSGEELRTESVELYDSCTIRVDGDPQDVRWRQLFDSPLVLELAEWLDVEWVQDRRNLVLLANAAHVDRASVEQLDTMCRGAQVIAGQMIAIATQRQAASGVDDGLAA